MSARTSSLLALALVLPPGGCVLPHLLSWEIGWEEPGLEGRAAHLEASIRQGGCDGEVVWIEEVSAGSASWDEPPTLGEGRYGFAARARDARCVWYAAGCRVLDLPGQDQGSLLVILSALAAPEPACAQEACIGGACACAGSDCGNACTSMSCDCPLGDCTMRCEAGGDCSCAGGVCNVRCEAGATCSCAGGACVMDCEVGATCSCPGGACTMACAEGAECSCLGGGCG